MPIDSVIGKMSDPNAVKQQVISRLGRAIINHLNKANKQLRAHTVAFPRKNLVRLVLLVNEDHEIYDPEVVHYIVGRAVRALRNGKPRYDSIDCVVYISERHAKVAGDAVAFVILSIEGPPLENDVWKRAVVQRFVDGWALWNRAPLYVSETLSDFSVIDHVPKVASRDERWRLNYRRAPYMRDLTDEQIRDRFNECMVISMLAFLKERPVTLTTAAVVANLEKFNHIQIEVGRRGLTLPELRYVPARAVAAAQRLGLSTTIIDWVQNHKPR